MRPGVIPIRLWNWFEMLPFYRGMTLIVGVVLVPLIAIGLLLGYSGADATEKRAVPPVPRKSATTPEPTPTWMEYVPPRKDGPNRVLVRPRTGSPAKATPTKPTSTRTPRVRPSRTAPRDEED